MSVAPKSAEPPTGPGVLGWLRRTDWLWMIIGGFYLVAYLYWYIPALRARTGRRAVPRRTAAAGRAGSS